MIEVSFNKIGTVDDCQFKFAVICAKYREKWIFCKHKNRKTWEIPGGHREAGEAIDETARRELIEETGAKEFDIIPLTAYCVEKDREKTYGMLFFAKVTELADIPFESEINEISLFDTIPDELTYPKIQPYLHEFATENTKQCYSYVMGTDDAVLSLGQRGFDVKRDGENYTVTFPKVLSYEWENFISENLKFEYWNEYFTDDKWVFLFHLKDGIERYEVENHNNSEVLALCRKLCACEFASIKDMLFENWFYREKTNDQQRQNT